MGDVTQISHILGKSNRTYPKGDLVFDVGTVGRFNKGWPFQVIDTDWNNYTTDMGVPSRDSEEGYQAYYALYNIANTVGHYVNVRASDAKYPWISINNLGVTANGASTFDTMVAPSGDIQYIAYLKNGEVRENKIGIKLTDIDTEKETFVLTVVEKLANGTVVNAEDPQLVSLTPGATKASGAPLFIESVFDNNSDIVGIKCIDAAVFSGIKAHDVLYFNGGLPGGDPTTADYQKAWDLLKAETVPLDQVFMAGDTDTGNIGYARSVAATRNIRLEMDNPAGMNVDNYLTWLSGLSISQDHNAGITYGMISFNDPFYKGSRKTMRLSGLLTQIKGYCREYAKTTVDPSINEAPAGENQGLLRGLYGVRNETNLTDAEKVKLAAKWTNYIVNSVDTGIIAWEQFTLYGEDCGYAYKNIIDVINYLYKLDKDIMQKEQFRSKTDAQIISLLEKPRKRLKAAGVLITSDDVNEENQEAYSTWITTTGNKKRIHRSVRIQGAIGAIELETILL